MPYPIVAGSRFEKLQAQDLPKQNSELVLLMAERHTRATAAMEPWATPAKRAVDFVEGRQWSAEDLQKAHDEGRPALTFNKVGALVRLVLGYHRNNRVDAKYLPDDDAASTEQVGHALTKLTKRVSESNQEPFIDTEVFLDGIITGRGYYDQRLSFEKNILGEIKVSARDPFTIKVDPDAENYDLNEGCSYVQEDRWVSIDEIEVVYGVGAAALVYPLVHRSGYAGMPSSLVEYAMEEITPWRTFGGQFDRFSNNYMGVESYLANAYDPARKTVRLVDTQHKVRVWSRYIVDLDTGDMERIPDHFDEARVQKIMLWAEAKFRTTGQPNPLRLVKRLGNRVRWTTMVGDVIVYDKWSAYESYTLTPFFPYFRRGKTRGMVEDLIDPQLEINKRRSSNIDIITRTAHSGWTYHENSLRPEEQDKLENYGAAPGINIKWKGEEWMRPQKIEPGSPPMAFERLEQRATDDMRDISGVNAELMGMDDTVKSGRAIEARQRQGVMAIQVYMDNMSRSKELVARKKLELIQNHYTERRVYRVVGDNGKSEILTINDKKAAATIINDVTLGKYKVSIDETPLSATFAAAQFDEILMLVEKGIIPKEIIQDVAIDASSIPHKDAIKKRVEALQKAMGMPTVEELETGQILAELGMGPDGSIMPAGQIAAQQAAKGGKPAAGGAPGGQIQPGSMALPAPGPGQTNAAGAA